MKIIRSLRQMSDFSRAARKNGKSVGFVPTMGALHEGHLSLVRKAREDNDAVVVSIFVNPTQFGLKEDLKKYPRNLKGDAFLCREEGADVVFCPRASEMYPQGYGTYVTVEGLSDVLCGAFRPGHFRGVATVVAKLFNIVMPDVAYFGQKDAQQALIIQKMVNELNVPIKIKVMPTVRQADGLALSSRNIYLSPEEKKDAVVIPQALELARDLFRGGQKMAPYIIRKMKLLIGKKRRARVQYISIVDLKELRPVKEIRDRALVALAVYFGKTRLIDNIILG